MNASSKLKEELKSVALYTLFFGAWFAIFILLKTLILAEYEIRFSGLSAAFVGALILAKVVLLLEHVSLGKAIARRPAWLELGVRTLLYGVGVLLVLLLEKAFEVRHEKGGVLRAVAGILHHEDIPHVLANAVVASCALLAFNMLSLIRKRLGAGALVGILGAPSGHAH